MDRKTCSSCTQREKIKQKKKNHHHHHFEISFHNFNTLIWYRFCMRQLYILCIPHILQWEDVELIVLHSFCRLRQIWISLCSTSFTGFTICFLQCSNYASSWLLHVAFDNCIIIPHAIVVFFLHGNTKCLLHSLWTKFTITKREMNSCL